MTSVKFVLVNPPTNTAKYLTTLVFNKEALSVLRSYGLVNVYLDDYGHTKKYKDCLFFLFFLKDDLVYEEFQNKLANFNSFYDYYDVVTPANTMRMYVFKVHDLYRQDLFSFKHSRFDEFTKHFYDVSESDLDFSKVTLDLSEEIYRFNDHLEIIKEDL